MVTVAGVLTSRAVLSTIHPLLAVLPILCIAAKKLCTLCHGGANKI